VRRVALAWLFASSTRPRLTSVVPPKFSTPKMSMISSGTTRLKKRAARLRTNIFTLAIRRAQ